MGGCAIIEAGENVMVKTKTGLSPQDGFLRYCAQLGANNRVKKSPEKLLRRDLNWPAVLQKSKTEGISCLLYHNLLQFRHLVPKDIWNSLTEIYYTNTSRNIRIYRQISAVLASLNQEGLAVIPLKGIFLAEKVYGNIALRKIGDIDLLIKRQDLPRIDQVLGNLGYHTPIQKKLLSYAIKKAYLNSIDYFKGDRKSPTLHLHWHIVNVSLPTYMYSQAIQMERFWQFSQASTLAAAPTFEFSPEHLIIYLSEHAVKHSFDRLILLSDIDAVIKRYEGKIDWEKLIQEAKGLGMQRQLFYSLYLTKDFLDADIPERALSSIEPKRWGFLERKFFNSVCRNRRKTKLCYFVYLNMVKGVMNKSRFVLRTFFPAPCVLALTFNLNKPKITIRDYLKFLKKQASHLKRVFIPQKFS